MRDALNLLQQLNTYYGSEIKLPQVQAMLGISGDQRSKELVKHIVAKDVAAGVATINNVNSDGLDLRQFNRDVVEYLRLLLLVKTGSVNSLELTAEDIKELKDLAAKASTAQALKAVKRFGQLDLSLDNYSTLPLELALVDSILPDEEKIEYSPKAEPEPTVKKVNPTAMQSPSIAKANPSSAAPKAAVRPVEKKTPETAAPEVRKVINPEPPPKSAPHVDSPLAAGSAIEQLQAQWTKIINESPDGMSKTPAAALLRSARPVSIENDTLVVSVKHQYHKEKMDILENQKTVDKIVSSFLGRPCKVRCVYEHENNHLVKAALNMGAQVIDAEGK
jgi:DNA polymerase-3 subunit gamma/tau